MSDGEQDPIFTRLEDQITWYDRKSQSAQHIYKRLKVLEIFAAAIIPFLAGFHFDHVMLLYRRTGRADHDCRGRSAPEPVPAELDELSLDLRSAPARKVCLSRQGGSLR
jgi:Protein of unknown function (DUF4231)